MKGSTSTIEHRNEVRLVGRVSGDPTITELPSGDVVVTVRLVVERPPLQIVRPRAQKVDTLACAAWKARVRHAVAEWSSGDIVEVEGALRRRFWQGAGGAQSRYEVELVAARRLESAAETAAAAEDAAAGALSDVSLS
jgi:single-strand DNA-binding protein